MSGEKMEHSPQTEAEIAARENWQMYVDCNEELIDKKAAIAELVAWLTNFAHADLDDAAADAVTVGQVLQKDALRLIAKHKAGE